MSSIRASGLANEPGLIRDEAEASAFRLSGGPIDTAKNPIQYFGNRGALAGHIDQVDKFIKRVPKLQLITAYDAVSDSKGKTIYATDQAVHAAEAERELKAIAPSRAIIYTTTAPTPSVEMRSRAVNAAIQAFQSSTPSSTTSIPQLTTARTMGPNEWNRYGVNEHDVKNVRAEAFECWLLSLGRVDQRDRLRELFESEERPAVELRNYLIAEAAKATATEKTVVHNDYSNHVDHGLVVPITRLGFEEYLKVLHLLRLRLNPTDPRAVGKAGEDANLAERIFGKFLTDDALHDRVERAREITDTAGDFDATVEQLREIFRKAEAKQLLVQSNEFGGATQAAMAAEKKTNDEVKTTNAETLAAV